MHKGALFERAPSLLRASEIHDVDRRPGLIVPTSIADILASVAANGGAIPCLGRREPNVRKFLACSLELLLLHYVLRDLGSLDLRLVKPT